MESWENLILQWINCLCEISSDSIKSFDELEDGKIYFKLINQVKIWDGKDYSDCQRDMVLQFLKDEYPSYEFLTTNRRIKNLCIAFLVLSRLSLEPIFHKSLCTNLHIDIQIKIKSILESVYSLERNITEEDLCEAFSLVDKTDCKTFSTKPKRILEEFLNSPVIRSVHSDNKIYEQTRQIRHLKADIEILKYEKSELIEDIKNQEKQIEELKHKLQKSLSELKSIRQENSKINNADYSDKLQDTKSVELFYKKELQSLENYVSELQNDNYKLQDEKDCLISDLETYKLKCHEIEEKNINNEQTLESILLQMEKKDEELTELKLRHEELWNHLKENTKSFNNQSFETDDRTIYEMSLNRSEALSSVVEIQLQDTKKELNIIQNKYKNIDTILTIIIEEYEKLEEKFKAVYKENLEIKSELEEKYKIEKEYEKLKETFETETINYIAIKSKLEEKCNFIEDNYEKLKCKFETLTTENVKMESLLTEKCKIEKDYVELKNTLETVTNKSNEIKINLEEKCKAIEEKYEILKNKYEITSIDNETKIKSLMEEKCKLLEEYEKLKLAFETSTNENSEMKSELEEKYRKIQEEYENLNNKFEVISISNTEMKSMLEEQYLIEDEYKKLKIIYETVSNEKNEIKLKLEEKCKKIQEEYENLQNEFDVMSLNNNEMKSMLQEKSELGKEYEKLKMNFETISNSNSETISMLEKKCSMIEHEYEKLKSKFEIISNNNIEMKSVLDEKYSIEEEFKKLKELFKTVSSENLENKSRFEEKYKNMEEKYQNLKTEFESVSTDNIKMKSIIEDKCKMEQEYEQLKITFETTSSENSEIKSKLEEQCKSIQDEYEKLQNKFDALSDNNAEMKSVLDQKCNIEKDHEKLKNMLETVTSENAEMKCKLEEKCKSIQDEYEKLKIKSEEMSADNINLNALLENKCQIEEESEKLKSTLQSVSKENDELKSQLEEKCKFIEVEYEKLKNKFEEISVDNTHMKVLLEDKCKIEEENKKLRDTLESVSNNNAQLISQLEEKCKFIEKEYEELKIKFEEISTDNINMKVLLENKCKIEEESERLKNTLESVSSDNALLKSQLEEKSKLIEKECAKLKIEYETVSNDNNEMKSALEEKCKLIEEQNKLIQEYKENENKLTIKEEFEPQQLNLIQNQSNLAELKNNNLVKNESKVSFTDSLKNILSNQNYRSLLLDLLNNYDTRETIKKVENIESHSNKENISDSQPNIEEILLKLSNVSSDSNALKKYEFNEKVNENIELLAKMIQYGQFANNIQLINYVKNNFGIEVKPFPIVQIQNNPLSNNALLQTILTQRETLLTQITSDATLKNSIYKCLEYNQKGKHSSEISILDKENVMKLQLTWTYLFNCIHTDIKYYNLLLLLKKNWCFIVESFKTITDNSSNIQPELKQLFTKKDGVENDTQNISFEILQNLSLNFINAVQFMTALSEGYCYQIIKPNTQDFNSEDQNKLNWQYKNDMFNRIINLKRRMDNLQYLIKMYEKNSSKQVVINKENKSDCSKLSNEDKIELKKQAREFQQQMKEMHEKYELKLEKMKEKMKSVYNNQMAILKKEQEQATSSKLEALQLKIENLCYSHTEELKKYKKHISELTTQLWDVGEKLIIEKQKKEDALQKLKLSKMSIDNHSKKYNDKDKENYDHSNLTIKSEAEFHSPLSDTINKIRDVRGFQLMGNPFKTEDEEGELFDTTYLSDMQRSRRESIISSNDNNRQTLDRLSILQLRNAKCKPHLKSSYPAELQIQPGPLTEDEIKTGSTSEEVFNDSLSQSLLTGKKVKRSNRTRNGSETPRRSRRFSNIFRKPRLSLDRK